MDKVFSAVFESKLLTPLIGIQRWVKLRNISSSATDFRSHIHFGLCTCFIRNSFKCTKKLQQCTKNPPSFKVITYIGGSAREPNFTISKLFFRSKYRKVLKTFTKECQKLRKATFPCYKKGFFLWDSLNLLHCLFC